MREERGELRVIQVATYGTEGTKSAVLTAARGYRSKEYPNGIDPDEAQYISSLIPSERGFLWPLDDVVKGNQEKDRKPIQQFIDKMNEYPGLLDIIYGIDGLVNKRSQHASGVILYNDDPWKTSAVMRSPNGDLITQFALHQEEALGGTKFDLLVTEICDKLINAISLLKNDGYFNGCETLRNIYDKYLHPKVLDIKDGRIWDTLAKGEVVDLFQFDSPVGGQAIKSILPRNPLQLMMANALTRLAGEKGEERPIDKYVRFKNNIQLWYKECRDWKLTEDEIKVLEPYYLPAEGVPTTQEKLMLLCMDSGVAHFSLAEANAARKVCSKKQLNKIPELKEKFIGQCPRKELGEYVWWSAILPQLSYAFAEPHALAYSFIAIQILVLTTYYPIIYWNCACLITNSGGDIIAEQDNDDNDEDFEDDDDEDDSEEAESEKKKKKTKSTDYGKVATAIGNFQARGIKVNPPNINESLFTFSPDVQHNIIRYGLRGIAGLSIDTIKDIIANRPYTSFNDCLTKVKMKKPQIINLIKAGAFDEIEDLPREQIMHNYLDTIVDKKQRLTLQNFPMLIAKDLIPEEMIFYKKLFLFNKFLKDNKSGIYYNLNEAAVNFISTYFDSDLIDNGDQILQKVWDNTYKKAMEPMRIYLKENKDIILARLNDMLYDEVSNKYAIGNISSWEMSSLSFYYHDHELAKFKDRYEDFFSLSEDPEIDYSFTDKKSGKTINVYKIHAIIGTVIDKDKVRNTITLLTPTGVVLVKIYKNQFALYDKQISERGDDGKRHIIERSWFKRGTLLRVQGIRRGDNFIPKKLKSSVYPVICKIVGMEDDELKLQTERLDVE